MSGGCQKANLVQIATKPALVAPAFNKLNQSFLPQEMQVALDCPDRPIEDSGQCLHLWPAESRLVVAVVTQGAVGWDHFSWDSGLEKILNFRDTGKFLVNSHHNNLSALAAVRPMVRFIHRAVVSSRKDMCHRFFYALLMGNSTRVLCCALHILV
jgi:hypothetical protein